MNAPAVSISYLSVNDPLCDITRNTCVDVVESGPFTKIKEILALAPKEDPGSMIPLDLRSSLTPLTTNSAVNGNMNQMTHVCIIAIYSYHGSSVSIMTRLALRGADQRHR